MTNTSPSQIEISTTLPSLEYLPFPSPHPDITFFSRQFFADDLNEYLSFLNRPLLTFGKSNPAFDASNNKDRFQRILQSAFAHGVHIGFFQKREGKFEMVGEGGVHIPPKSGWPSIYWTSLNIEGKAGEINWKVVIPMQIQAFWWSIPRKNAQLRVESTSLLIDSRGKSQPVELLIFQGINDAQRMLPDFIEYEKSYRTSWGKIPISTTLPNLKHLHHSIPPSKRLTYRPLTLSDTQAFHSIRKQSGPMKASGSGNPDPDLEFSHRVLLRILTPGYHHFPFNIGIFLKGAQKGEEGEMIGYLGVHLGMTTLQRIGYILKEEYQGKGYGSEFLRAFVQYWSGLPRKQVSLLVDPSILDFPLADARVAERLEAQTETQNLPSQVILQKSGFRKVFTPSRRYFFWHRMMQ
ncbi:hypothetical protein GQX73_g7864 [Xylaria multiplex]|uniref:N-acetyltransferase domain-containing protein n=1 Tax=Xylaria multiplex TaxID=323545 RepID=A0A7C8IK86_9PEZI|nr:hypothetical protein GQX73_g7864 [Xylaria multiplex]